MCLKKNTPCDNGECPFNAEYSNDCEYWCGAEEPQDDYEDYDLEIGFDPYMGCYSDDC